MDSGKDAAQQKIALVFQRILWVLENDLAAGMTMNLAAGDLPWDSHARNVHRQGNASRRYLLRDRQNMDGWKVEILSLTRVDESES